MNATGERNPRHNLAGVSSCLPNDFRQYDCCVAAVFMCIFALLNGALAGWNSFQLATTGGAVYAILLPINILSAIFCSIAALKDW